MFFDIFFSNSFLELGYFPLNIIKNIGDLFIQYIVPAPSYNCRARTHSDRYFMTDTAFNPDSFSALKRAKLQHCRQVHGPYSL